MSAPMTQAPAVTLSAEDAHFLAVRLRRLCARMDYTLPKFAADDAPLVNIAGTVIGALLAREDQRILVLRRLHDWALAQQGGCVFSGDHPIAQAAATLAGRQP